MDSKQEVRLNSYMLITDLSLFLKSHFEILKSNPGNRFYMPYYERLQLCKQVLIKNKTNEN
jgi:hypothetical protein